MIDRTDFPSQKWTSAKPQVLPLAPVLDRFLATGFDMVLFAPVISLMLSPLFRKLEIISLSSPTSTEFTVLAVLAVVYVCILTVLLQTLFLVWKKATPGQWFFKIRVVDFENPQNPLSLTQTMLRSTLWVLEFFILLLPFLEVFSHHQRRPMHDRAAGTIVITKKEIGEAAPHPFEADLVRKMLALSFLVIFFWSLAGVSYFYKMAMRGEFKRSELIADNFLCPQVSDSLSSEDNQSDAVRLDKAVALYLAGEVTDDCVQSEADFALWSSSEEGSSWAYFAKGVIKKYDKELALPYFDKACEAGESIVACELAKLQMTSLSLPDAQIINADYFTEEMKKTETAKIMVAVDDYDRAQYQKAEKNFIDLKSIKGFGNFAQKGLIKSLWAQGQIEKAEGAFLSSLLQTNIDTRNEISAWMCAEQLDADCSQKSRVSCENLKAEYVGNFRPIESTMAAIALLKEKDCRKTTEIDLGRFHDLFEQYPDLLSFAQALSDESSLSASERLDSLRELAFRKNPVRPAAVRSQSLQVLAEKSMRRSDQELITKYLSKRKVKDLAWSKVFSKMKKREASGLDPEERQPASIRAANQEEEP